MMEHTNVMHIVYSNAIGGLEKVVVNLCKRLKRGNYNLSICSLTEGKFFKNELMQDGIPVFVEKKHEGIDLSLPWRLAKLFKTHNVDLIHTHNISPWLYGTMGARVAGIKAIVHTEHSNLFSNQKKLKITERFLANFTNVIIADSKEVKYGLIQQGIKEEKIVIVYNGVEVNLISTSKLVLKKRLNLPEDAIVIGTVARLVPLKNIDLLIEVSLKLFLIYPNLRVVVIGGGPLLNHFKRKAEKLKERIKFLGEINNARELLNIFDIFVLPSLSEGMPIAVLEAMATGLPVVATNVGGVSEVVEDSQTGFLVPSGNSNIMAEAIIKILNNPELAKTMGEEGKKRVKEKFSLEKMVNDYEFLYEEHFKNRYLFTSTLDYGRN